MLGCCLIRTFAESIDVCINECCAFVGEHGNADTCPKCHEPRFDSNRKPRRRFLYFPVVPQLQRLFASPQLAEQLRWAGTHAKTAGIIKDITESPGWQKHVVDGGFFNDIRNIVLSLCGDGVNPFDKSAHSVWPLMVSVLNLPPHLRNRHDTMILLGIIPGPHSTANINLYLSCLSAELVAYGEPGVWTRDAFANESFLMRFKVLKIVADYPAASKI
ncbi:MAG: transposase family protein, partial [Sulfobacillus sp.]